MSLPCRCETSHQELKHLRYRNKKELQAGIHGWRVSPLWAALRERCGGEGGVPPTAERCKAVGERHCDITSAKAREKARRRPWQAALGIFGWRECSFSHTLCKDTVPPVEHIRRSWLCADTGRVSSETLAHAQESLRSRGSDGISASVYFCGQEVMFSSFRATAHVHCRATLPQTSLPHIYF